ncbi:hypothetical protein Prudu_013892, partial [Prunus dulcis]
SAAKQVRRHGVDLNRGCNEEICLKTAKGKTATARPPQAEPISAVGTIGSASVSPSRPDRPQPRGRPELPENHGVEVRGIHHRANHSFRAKVENFGIGQNTGETLPKFRQKFKGILKKI